MKKFRLLLVLVTGATTLAAARPGGVNPSEPPGDARAVREARACKALLRRMAAAPSADTWRNRMRVWSCRKAGDDADRTASVVVGSDR